jgi:hypothetical protein
MVVDDFQQQKLSIKVGYSNICPSEHPKAMP